MRLLVDAGADINLASNDNTTALMAATVPGQSAALSLLLNKNNAGVDDPLTVSQASCTELLQLLLGSGAQNNNKRHRCLDMGTSKRPRCNG